MKKELFYRIVAVVFAMLPGLAAAQDIIKPDPIGEPATKLYRQILPDGRIIYSDKQIKGAKLDDTLKVDPDSNGKSWKPESGKRPTLPPRAERTPVQKVPTVPPLNKRKTLDEAEADVIKSEMLLEDAKKRQQAGVEPLPGERTGNAGGGSRLNERYEMRQKALAHEVAEAEAMLQRSRNERDAVRTVR
jgi:hypothetical protein